MFMPLIMEDATYTKEEELWQPELENITEKTNGLLKHYMGNQNACYLMGYIRIWDQKKKKSIRSSEIYFF